MTKIRKSSSVLSTKKSPTQKFIQMSDSNYFTIRSAVAAMAWAALASAAMAAISKLGQHR